MLKGIPGKSGLILEGLPKSQDLDLPVVSSCLTPYSPLACSWELVGEEYPSGRWKEYSSSCMFGCSSRSLLDSLTPFLQLNFGARCQHREWLVTAMLSIYQEFWNDVTTCFSPFQSSELIEIHHIGMSHESQYSGRTHVQHHSIDVWVLWKFTIHLSEYRVMYLVIYWDWIVFETLKSIVKTINPVRHAKNFQLSMIKSSPWCANKSNNVILT